MGVGWSQPDKGKQYEEKANSKNRPQNNNSSNNKQLSFQTSTSYVPPITSLPGSNPCTQDALNRGQRFFPYPPDEHKYIACTEWPNYGVIKDCDPYHK